MRHPIFSIVVTAISLLAGSFSAHWLATKRFDREQAWCLLIGSFVFAIFSYAVTIWSMYDRIGVLEEQIDRLSKRLNEVE